MVLLFWEGTKEGREEGRKEEEASLPLKIGAMLSWGWLYL